VQGALKELKRKVKKSGMMDELKEKEYFIPKGEKRKLKRIKARQQQNNRRY
jgi:ribosomal protein S21